ncbi:TPA_asm: N [Pelargonium alphacytorhabdovirus 1]|nr:TPA_asm: N [Pelargonium alphacytorhabdovirus 1]
MEVSGLLRAIATSQKYAEADNITVSMGRRVTVWEEHSERSIRIYDVSIMSDTDCMKYGTYMMDCLKTGTRVNADLVSVMLNLAVSLRSPDDVSTAMLQKPHNNAERNIAFVRPELAEVDRTVPTDQTALLAQLKAMSSAQNVEQSADATVGEVEVEGEQEEFSAPVQASVYTYLAGFLLRLQCRQVDNVHGNLGKAAERFRGWYDEGAAVITDLGISKETLETLKGLLARKPEIVGTWVMWLATTENEVVLNQQPRGLLEYIGLQIYAYQGLHVVSQILTIKQISKAPMGLILRELDCPITRDGVREVYNIIMNYEVTDAAPNRKTYFRYARVWGEGYFLKIRSAACAPLLYTAAKVVKEISTNAKSDPTNIYAVQNIGDALKAKLNKAAGNLVDMLLSSVTVDAESGQSWAD